MKRVAVDAAHQQIVAVGYGKDLSFRTWLWQEGSWKLQTVATSPPNGAMSNLEYDPKLSGLMLTVLRYPRIVNLP